MKNAFLIVLILILGCQPNKPEIKSKLEIINDNLESLKRKTTIGDETN